MPITSCSTEEEIQPVGVVSHARDGGGRSISNVPGRWVHRDLHKPRRWGRAVYSPSLRLYLQDQRREEGKPSPEAGEGLPDQRTPRTTRRRRRRRWSGERVSYHSVSQCITPETQCITCIVLYHDVSRRIMIISVLSHLCSTRPVSRRITKHRAIYTYMHI